MENDYSVYIHIFPNNKVYIGITLRNPIKRWGHKGYGYRLQPKMYNAINKYGWDNIQHNILFSHLSKEEAERKEKELIKKYNAIANGYNIELGGNTGGKHSEETKAKISMANKGKPKSDITKKKISEANKGRKVSKEEKERLRMIASKPKSDKGKEHIREGKLGRKNPMYGKHMTEEAKRKRSVYSRKVIQCDTNGNVIKVWDSARQASKQLEINCKNIRRSCTSKYNAGGYKFKYAES